MLYGSLYRHTKEAKDITLSTTVDGREIVITGLTGSRCPVCKEEYLDADSSEKSLEIANKFRKPAIVFKRKVTVSGGRRVIGIPEEIDRALGKKENVDIWLEGDKIISDFLYTISHRLYYSPGIRRISFIPLC